MHGYPVNGEMVRSLKKARGLPIRKLAAEMRIARQTIYNAQNGAKVSPTLLKIMADYFELPDWKALLKKEV
jgi:transcriptional regulator with XRE-family HTH domain